MSAESLKMLSPSSVDPRKVGRTTGDHLTASDVAHALGKIGDEARLYAHVSGALEGTGDPKAEKSVRRELEVIMLLRTIDLAHKQNWHIEQANILWPLVRLALDESIQGALCKTCNGQGSASVAGRYVVCGDCGGRKYRRWTDEERAEYLGIKVRQWRKKWIVRYRYLTGWVSEWEAEIQGVLNRG